MSPSFSRTSRVQRTLEQVGFDTQLVDAVVGDLTEEFAARVTEQGIVGARLWYAKEMLRSAPHLFLGTVRRGGRRARLLLAWTFGFIVLTSGATTAAVLMHEGPPVKLVSDLSDAADNVLLNNTRPVKLPMRVLDRRGHVLEQQPVRYEWIAGMPIDVSADGVLTCEHRGDAVVRATLHDMVKELAIRCRPVEAVRASSWIDLVAGGGARELPFVALGEKAHPVDELRGVLRVQDSTIVALHGMVVRPRTVGSTIVNVAVGDRKAPIRVIVNELVTSFTNLRPDQRFVAQRVRLAQGDTVRLALPIGYFWLKYVPARPGEAPPSIAAQGRASCALPTSAVTLRTTEDIVATTCSVDGPAAVDLQHGKVGAQFVEGYLILERR